MTATARAGAVLIADRGGLCFDDAIIMVSGGARFALYFWVQKNTWTTLCPRSSVR